MTHWLLVGSVENFEISRRRGFDFAGMKTRWKNAAQEVRVGDTFFFYLTKIKAIGGEAVVVDQMFYDETPIWESTKPGEVNAWRFPVEPVKIRPKDDYLPVADFIDRYKYARKWPFEHWTLAFQGNVHRLNDQDYALIHGLL